MFDEYSALGLGEFCNYPHKFKKKTLVNQQYPCLRRRQNSQMLIHVLTRYKFASEVKIHINNICNLTKSSEQIHVHLSLVAILK